MADGPSIRRVMATSVVDQVTAEIRRSILSGALRPGQEFSLRELAGELGVSFIPVREALRRLEGQGLLITRPGRSAVVAPMDAADLHGIYRLRRVIEPEIAGRSCLSLTEAELARLERVERTFADERLNLDEIYEAHHQFHLDLLSPAATPWDLRTLESLWRAAERYVRLAFGARDDRGDEHARREKAHAELLDAFRSRQPEVVERMILAHLTENEAIAQDGIAALG